uniref:Uncharacterized protein n=1 Tax=Geospiza parvula TaxID=87175 RepID=A0A8U8BXJ0_GEOPR
MGFFWIFLNFFDFWDFDGIFFPFFFWIFGIFMLSERYGPVFTVWLGTRPVVVLRGTEAVREALVGNPEAFAGRGRLPTLESTFRGYGEGPKRPGFNPKTRWRQLRRFSLSVLRDFGMGRRSIESRIQEEAQELLKAFQDTQEQVFEEISRVIGPGRAPALADRALMPFTDAVIHEIQRCSDLLPMNVPHRVTQDTRFRGYLIPKGTDVYPLLSSVLHDPKSFRNPQKFDPGNFLDERGRFQRNEAFVPFSAGGTFVPGESLARSELFLFLASLLQRLRPEPLGPPESVPTAPRESGFGNIPPAFRLRLLPR